MNPYLYFIRMKKFLMQNFIKKPFNKTRGSNLHPAKDKWPYVTLFGGLVILKKEHREWNLN